MYRKKFDKRKEREYTEEFHTAQPNSGCTEMRLQTFYKDFIKDSEDRGLAKNTIHGIKLYLHGSLSHSIQWVDPEKLTMKHYQKALEAGKKHGKYGEVQTAKTLKQFLHYLNIRGVKTGIDWRDLKNPRMPKKRVEYLTKEDVEKIRHHIPDTTEGQRTRAMFELGLSTGMRIGEICSLDKKDIDFTAKTAYVMNCKTGEYNTLSFTTKASSALESYLKGRTDNDDSLFYAFGRGRLKTVTARSALTKIEKTLNLGKDLHWHLLRKSFISHLVFGGMDIREVQAKARHSDPSITLRHYTALRDNEATKKQIDIMEEI